MRRALVILAVALGLGLGLLRATDTAGPAVEAAPDWYSRVADVDAALSASGAARVNGAARALEAGLLFPDRFLAPGSAEALAAAAADSDTPQDAPPLPALLSAGVVDGVAGVQIKDATAPDTPVLTVSVGEATPGGWTLVATDLRTAVFRWGEVEQTLDIRPAAPLQPARGRNRTRNNRGNR